MTQLFVDPDELSWLMNGLDTILERAYFDSLDAKDMQEVNSLLDRLISIDKASNS